MSDLFNTQPAYVQSGETLPVLASMINADHATNDKSARDSALRAKLIGDRLNEAKGRLPHGGWLDWLNKNIKFSRQQAARYMRVSANWSKCNPGLHLAEIYRFLAEDDQDDPPVASPTPAPANSPLCPRCDRNVRVHRSAPTKGCQDCKRVREADEAARRAAATQAPQYEEPSTEGAEDAGEDQEESTPEPPKPKKQEAVPTMVEFSQIVGQFLKAIDTIAKSIGHKTVHSRPDMADSVVETREVLGFRRRIEELKNDVAKWLKSAKRNNPEG